MIDFHVHQPSTRWSYEPTAFIGAMDELGTELSVVFTYDGLLHPSPAANDALARWVGAAPERMVAFATVDPRDPSADQEIERCVRDLGMRGVKLHPWLQGFSVHDDGLDRICRAAARLNVPVLFHDGTPPSSTPLQLATLARRHPETSIILGHGGLHDLWREAIAAVLSTGNVHLCMCATPGYAMRAIVAQCPLDRLLFGTDAGLRPEPLPRYAMLRVAQLDELDLTPEQRRAILEVNPRRMLEGLQ